jgi:hypothetical protein
LGVSSPVQDFLSGDPLDMGTVLADGPGGQLIAAHLTVSNRGEAPLTITRLQLAAGNHGFSIVGTNPAGTTLPPGDSTILNVLFDPSVAGTASDTLTITSDDPNGPFSMALTGNGLTTRGQLSVSLAQDPNTGAGINNFGGVQLGAPPLTLSHFATVTNNGGGPLTVSNVLIGPGQVEFALAGLPPGFGPSNPVVLAPGQSFDFEVTFAPDQIGLLRGQVQISSDDPNTPVFYQGMVGTGLPATGTALDYGHDFVAVENLDNPDNPVLRQVSDAMGNWTFFLPQQTSIHYAIFDPISGLIAHGYTTTAVSGQDTSLLEPVFVASTAPDSDGDGLPDDIEFAIGTNPHKVSTTGDGISDFAKIQEGLDPLADRPAITGVVAALNLKADATDIKVAVDAAQPNRQLAFIALGGGGLDVVDVTQFDRPTLLGQLALPGSSVDVEVDAAARLAAVAGDSGGLHLIDISDPAKPRLLRTLPVSTQHMVLFDGFVYAATSEGEIQAYDVSTGERIDTVAFKGPITSLRRDGTMLFAISTDPEFTLHAIDLSRDGMVLRGSLALRDEVTSLFVADGTAWMNAGAGIVTVDVSQPDQLQLLGNNPTLQAVGPVALNGSGLGIVASPAGNQGTLVVFRADDPALPGSLVTQFGLPALGRGVALSAGLAYVAAGSAGLQVVNFLPYDQGGTPPDVSVRVLSTNIDPAKPGIQMAPGATVQLAARITDDVQVRNVELLLNGIVVRNEVSYPYDLSVKLPVVHEPGHEAVLQVRATDTGGNVGLSEAVRIELVPDLTPPVLLQLDPNDHSEKPATFHKVTLQFSKPLDPATAVAANFELIGPNGPLPANSLLLRLDDTTLVVRYPLLAAGDYQFIIHAAAVTDRAGNALGTGDQKTSFRIAGTAPPPVPVELQAGRLTWTGNLPANAGPLSAVADFNRDGRLDIAGPFGSHGLLTTTVLLGQGDGSFQRAPDGPPNDFRTGIYNADQVATADFNNDGLPDLVGANGTLQVYLGHGDGTFGNVLYALPPEISSGIKTFALGDFNHDGNMDIIAGDGASFATGYSDRNGNSHNGLAIQPGGFVYVLLGMGDGRFTFTPGPINPPAASEFPLLHTRLLTADLNGDGNLDLIAIDGHDGKLRFVPGRGNGTFDTTKEIDTPLPAGALLGVLADLNGDGKLDAVVTSGVQANQVSSFVIAGNSVSVLFGRGDGTFDPPVSYDVPGAFDVMAADYTGDGHPDLLVTRPPGVPGTPNTDLAGLYLLVNKGNGSFAPAVRIAGPEAPLHLASGDFNRDGRPDVLMTDWNQGVSVLAGDNKGAFVTAQPYGVVPLDGNLHQLDVPLVTDLNGDGIPDVVLSERGGPIHVRLGKGDGTFQPTIDIPVPTVPPATGPMAITAMAAGDINGDGKVDLVVTSARLATPNLGILLGNGDGTFQPLQAFQLTPNALETAAAADLALADFNGDGVLDLVVGLVGPGSRGIAVIRGPILNRDNTLSPVTWVPLPIFPVRLQVGDFNGDHHLDVAALEPSFLTDPASPSRIAILAGRGDGTFSLARDLVLAPPNSVDLAAADVDDDGRLDLVTAASQYVPTDKGGLDVLRGNGDGTFERPVRYAEDQRWGYFRVTVADVNGDGHPDLVGSITDASNPPWFNADGSSRGVGVVLNKGDGTFDDVTIYDHAGLNIAGIAAADFNRDGLTDILTANGNDNTFSILFAKRRS